MKYTELTAEYIIPVLEYARDNGISAAARKFRLNRNMITQWNYTYQIYPMRAPYRQFTDAQKQEILKYARDNGVSVAGQKYDVKPSLIYSWNQTMHVFQSKVLKHFTDKQKKIILRYANDKGLGAACRRFAIDEVSVYRWAEKFGIYHGVIEICSIEKKREILNYASDHGIMNASRKYNIHDSVIRGWNRELKVFVIPSRRKFTEDEIKAYLDEALGIMNKMPQDAQSAQASFFVIEEKYDICPSQMYLWNKKYQILPVRPKPQQRRQITDAEIEMVRLALAQAKGSKAAASRQTGIPTRIIARIVREYGLGR